MLHFVALPKNYRWAVCKLTFKLVGPKPDYATLYNPINLRTLFRVYVIEEFDDLFDDALKDISDANLIGVKLEGPMIKRGGWLSCLILLYNNIIHGKI